MFGWLKKPFSPSRAIAGIVDAVFARIRQYEIRITHGCDNGTPYYGFKIVKEPEMIDLDGDGRPD